MEAELLEQAVDLLAHGNVVGLPTDTVYGIAADPGNPQAVARLFVIKNRPLDKPIGLLVADLDAALELVDLPTYALRWVGEFWPGPLNLVGLTRRLLAPGVGDVETGTVGLRVPDHPVTLAVLQTLGPLAVTSANPSGGAETLDELSAAKALGDQVSFYLPGVCPGAVASTTVDVSGPIPRLLRKGPLDLGLKFEV